MQLYYQLSGPNAVADEPEVVVLLTRRVNGTTTTVGGGYFSFPALAATYTRATVPLFYTSALAPDSIAISIRSGGGQYPTAGTTLRIDDLSFVGAAAVTRDEALAADLSVSPNPSPDGHYRLNSAEPTLQRAALAVLDATGRVVRREAAPALALASRPLDLSSLSTGIYTLQLFMPTGVVTRKLSR
nr:T9SS type A sorting domain-containing protein [Hymenobacter cyanobacteriorum]